MKISTTLHDLIRKTGGGDQGAFSELYNQMSQPVFNHILRKYGHVLGEQDAADIVNATFLIIAIHASRYRGLQNDFSAKGWIFKIARSQASKMMKALNRTPVSLDDDSDDDPAAPERNSRQSDIQWEGGDSVEERVTNSLFLQRIPLTDLSDTEREVIEMRYLKGYTFKQIGSHNGKTKPWAKQIHDAIIRKIRKALGLNEDGK